MMIRVKDLKREPQVETLQGLEREVARLQAEVVHLKYPPLLFLSWLWELVARQGCKQKCWSKICNPVLFIFTLIARLQAEVVQQISSSLYPDCVQGGPSEKGGGGGEKKKLKPGGALQNHWAGRFFYGDNIHLIYMLWYGCLSCVSCVKCVELCWVTFITEPQSRWAVGTKCECLRNNVNLKS